MNSQPTRNTAAMGLISILLLSTGCAMTPPWRSKQMAQRDVAQDYIERTAANIQYDTDVASPNSTAPYSTASTGAYGGSSSSPASRSASGSGGSCCH